MAVSADQHQFADAFASALDAERIRNARRVNLLRMLTLSLLVGRVALLIILDLPVGFVELLPGITYWVIAVGLWFAGRASDSIARRLILAISIVDMPAISVLQWVGVQSVVRGDVTVSGVTGLTVAMAGTAPYLLLIALAMLSLHRWQVVVSAVVAAVCLAALQLEVGAPAFVLSWSLIVVLAMACVCWYAVTRTLGLVNDVSQEHLRRSRLLRYLSPQVARMVQEAGQEISAGRSCTVTILFNDIRDFTAMAEVMDSQEVVRQLNEYHAAMAKTVFEHGGTLDKFLGDGFMAYFGAPIAQTDHAARAVACALAMQERLAELNRMRLGRGQPTWRVGIGVHSGAVVLGDVGSPEQCDCTVVGDAVNVASRIEQLTKTYDASVLVSHQTRVLAGEQFTFAAAPEVQVKGKSQPLQTYVPGRLNGVSSSAAGNSSMLRA